jgi:ribonuclease HI
VGTNQQAELTAVLAALRGIPLDAPLRIETDSEYSLKSCTKWIPSWKKRGWKKSDGSAVANLDLMIDLDRAMAARTAPLEIVWVRGHNGHEGNEEADRIAGEAARAVSGKRKISTGPGWTGQNKKTAKAPEKPGLGLIGSTLPQSKTRKPSSAKTAEATLFDVEEKPKVKPLLSDTPDRNRLKSTLPTCSSCGGVINPFSGDCNCSR